LVKELNVYASQTVKMVSFIIPKNMPEIGGLLRSEHKSLTLMAMLSTDPQERALLLQKVKACVQRAEEITRVTRGESLLAREKTGDPSLKGLDLQMKKVLLQKLKNQVQRQQQALQPASQRSKTQCGTPTLQQPPPTQKGTTATTTSGNSNSNTVQNPQQQTQQERGKGRRGGRGGKQRSGAKAK